MYTIFGAGLDAVLFASFLSEKGIEFRLISTSNKIGGYFQGAKDCNDLPMDLGMVLLEPNDFNAGNKPLKEFAGDSGHKSRFFLRESYERFFPNHDSISKIPIHTKINVDEYGPDYFISDDLTMFANANSLMRSELSERIEWLKHNPEWHPRNKLDSESILSSVDIETAFRKIYGDAIYDHYFAGFIRNFLGEKVHLLPAKLHRRIWVPMIWPETLQNIFLNGPQSDLIFNPEFFAPTSEGTVSNWVRNLTEMIKRSSSTFIVSEEEFKNSVRSSKKQKDTFAFINPTSIDEPSGPPKPGITEFSQIRIVHACVDKTDSKLYFVNNNKIDVYRYSFQQGNDPDVSSAIFEFGQSAEALDDSQALVIVDDVLKDHGLRRLCLSKSYQSRFPINPEWLSLQSTWNSEYTNWQALSDSKSQSLNDNIVRAAWAIDRIE
jgi:hypothetical protein